MEDADGGVAPGQNMGVWAWSNSQPAVVQHLLLHWMLSCRSPRAGPGLRAQNARLLRLLDLMPQQALPRAAWQARYRSISALWLIEQYGVMGSIDPRTRSYVHDRLWPGLCLDPLTSWTASERASSHPLGPWFAPLRSDDRRDRGCSSASRTGRSDSASTRSPTSPGTARRVSLGPNERDRMARELGCRAFASATAWGRSCHDRAGTEMFTLAASLPPQAGAGQPPIPAPACAALAERQPSSAAAGLAGSWPSHRPGHSATNPALPPTR